MSKLLVVALLFAYTIASASFEIVYEKDGCRHPLIGLEGNSIIYRSSSGDAGYVRNPENISIYSTPDDLWEHSLYFPKHPSSNENYSNHSSVTLRSLDRDSESVLVASFNPHRLYQTEDPSGFFAVLLLQPDGNIFDFALTMAPEAYWKKEAQINCKSYPYDVSKDLVPILVRLVNGKSVPVNRGAFTELQLAVIRGDNSVLAQQIQDVPKRELNKKDALGMRPLHYCAIQGNADGLELLVRAGARLNALDNRGMTPVHYASMLGRGDVLKALVRYKADLDKFNDDEDTALVLAVEYNQFESVITLIQGGADRNLACKPSYGAYSQAPLDKALSNKNNEMLEYMYMSGCRFKITDHLNKVQLLVSYSADHLPFITRYLLEQGVDPNAFAYGRTALIGSVFSGDISVVELLLKYGADPNKQALSGFSPVAIAVVRENTDMLKFLLSNGADPNLPTKDGLMPLDYAVFRGADGCKACLLENGGLATGNLDKRDHAVNLDTERLLMYPPINHLAK